MLVRCLFVLAIAACGGPQVQRFPDEVQASLAASHMMKLETARFIIFYPEGKRDEIDRFLERAERCASEIQRDAIIKLEDKMVLAMPDVPYNNAFVLPDLLGYEPAAVIPLHATLDFATEFGLPPDPGYIACHEIVHYVHDEQIAGFWHAVNGVFGHLWTPQVAYNPWFFEGLATHYEAALQPGVGRPRWPIFTGMFAAGYADEHIGGGDLSADKRLANVGHHYLVGAMFMRFLTETYGERPVWVGISQQAHDLTGLFFTSSIKDGFGKSIGELIDEFDKWAHAKFPVRAPPAGQRHLATAGNDARYARGSDGTEAWVGDDVDLPSRLVIRDPRGATLTTHNLVDIVPPRTLVQGEPILVSGLSITDDGDVWLTVVDQATTYQVTRLLRWHRGDVTEVATGLGSGAAIAPRGDVYYYCAVDGDRWSLAAWDVKTHGKRTLVDVAPGQSVLGAQVSRDGTRLAANVWDGTAFVVWIIDAQTGAKLAELHGAGGTPIYDASFTSDGRVMYLGVIGDRFQAMIDGTPITDAPYAVLAPREANGTVRFLDREKWEWELAEVPLVPTTLQLQAPAPLIAPPPWLDIPILADRPYCIWDHFWIPTLHSPSIMQVSTQSPHLGFVLGGGDRLGFQRWNVAGYVQPKLSMVADAKWHYGATFDYLNTMLSPWQILADASIIDWADPIDTMDPKVKLADERRTRDASLSLIRTWRGSLSTALAGVYTDDFDHPDGALGVRRHLGGPSLTVSWLAAESTRYTEVRRGLFASASAAFYPHALSTFHGDITDVGGSVAAIAPLPIGRRHIVTLQLRGRALISREDTGLLQLGGDSGLSGLYNHSSRMEPVGFDDARFPPNLRFVETLRGYEDYGITTDRAAIADVSWRYPIIIDRGVVATLWWLPASFLREIDLELFGAAAIDRHHDQHVAGGAAVSLRVDFLRFPLIVQYQIARRIRDDDALTQLIAIGPDL